MTTFATMTPEERTKDINSRAAYSNTGRTGYKRATENALNQFHREADDYGSAELSTRETFTFLEITDGHISLGIMPKNAEASIIEREAFLKKVLELVPAFIDSILREEKRHSVEAA